MVCPSVVDNGSGEAEEVLVEPLSSVDDSKVDMLMDSVSVVEGN